MTLLDKKSLWTVIGIVGPQISYHYEGKPTYIMADRTTGTLYHQVSAKPIDEEKWFAEHPNCDDYIVIDAQFRRDADAIRLVIYDYYYDQYWVQGQPGVGYHRREKK